MAEFGDKPALVDEVIDEVEDAFLEVGGKGGVGADCLEGSEVKAAHQLPSAADSSVFVRSLSFEGSPQRDLDGRRRELRLLFYLLDELFNQLVLVLRLPTVLHRAIVVVNIPLRFYTASVDLFVLLEQLPQRRVANLLEVMLVIHLFHIVLPGLDYAVLMSLRDCLVAEEEFAHESVR